MKDRFVKSFRVSEVRYGSVYIEVSKDTSQSEAEFRVYEAINNGNVIWTDREVIDVVEEKY